MAQTSTLGPYWVSPTRSSGARYHRVATQSVKLSPGAGRKIAALKCFNLFQQFTPIGSIHSPIHTTCGFFCIPLRFHIERIGSISTVDCGECAICLTLCTYLFSRPCVLGSFTKQEIIMPETPRIISKARYNQSLNTLLVHSKEDRIISAMDCGECELALASFYLFIQIVTLVSFF